MSTNRTKTYKNVKNGKKKYKKYSKECLSPYFLKFICFPNKVLSLYFSSANCAPPLSHYIFQRKFYLKLSLNNNKK